jgi:ferrous iron transport protein A
MQLSFKKGQHQGRKPAKLAELPDGHEAVIERIDLPSEMATRLMELGFLPGNTVVAAHSAPGGDPRVFRVDGAEIALRRDTAAHLHLKM